MINNNKIYTLLKDCIGEISGRSEDMLTFIYKKFGYLLILFFFSFGLATTFINPPFQVPDEPQHLAVAIGRLEKIKNYFRSADKKVDLNCNYSINLSNHFNVIRTVMTSRSHIGSEAFTEKALQSVEIGCTPTNVSYGTVLTYPSVILASIISNDYLSTAKGALFHFYLSRIISGFLITLALLRFWHLHNKCFENSNYLIGGISLLVTFLAPIMVQQSFGVSSDGVTFICFILALQYAFFRSAQNPIDFLVLLVTLFATVTTKPNILPIIIAIFILGLIRADFFKGSLLKSFLQNNISKKHLYSILLTILLSFVWIARKDHSPQPSMRKNNVTASGQLKYIVNNPVKSFKMIDKVTKKLISFRPFFGRFGWLKFNQPKDLKSTFKNSLYLAIFFEALFIIGSRRKLSQLFSFLSDFKLRLTELVGIYCSIYITIFATCIICYLLMTDVGFKYINGLQARYVITAAQCWTLLLPLVLGYPLLLIHYIVNRLKSISPYSFAYTSRIMNQLQLTIVPPLLVLSIIMIVTLLFSIMTKYLMFLLAIYW